MSPPATSISYLVECWSCKKPFEALDTTFCACLVAEPTVVCNLCLACSCQAPPLVKKKFWEGAPDELWDRKIGLLRARKAPARANPDPGHVHRPLVLVVDPNSHVQRVVARVLAGQGYGMILAADGVAALDMIAVYQPELLLTEALLPKLDGRELCLRVRNASATANIKNVVMTGVYTSQAQRHEALRQFGVDEYLIKPVRPERLEDVLRRFLGSAP